MATRIQVRRDMSDHWVSIDPVLAQGEPGLELDTGKLKYGDGFSHWNELEYSTGNQGAQGEPGYIGVDGPQGQIGAQGFQGVQGGIGLQGSQGGPGTQGPQGIQGVQGANGLQGASGQQGSQGLQGFQGTKGNQGYQGDPGTTGPQGNQGAQGYQGYQGLRGYQGYQGNQGNQGIQGIGFKIAKNYGSVAALLADTAPTGINAGEFGIVNTGNVSDPDDAKLYLWTGTVWQFTTDLSGAAGITGPQGFQGYQGVQGSQGFQGNQGSQGIQGIDGTGVLVTSNNSIMVGTGIKFFNTVTRHPYVLGQRVRVVYAQDQNNFMEGTVSTITDAYSFSVNVSTSGSAGGSGPYNDWRITAIGIQGSQGNQGAQGLQGYQGSQGSSGPKGSDGEAGPQGNQGLVGSQGFQGSPGPQGFQGNQGTTGSQGSQGSQGATGYQGNQGNQGVQGSAGAQGGPGVQGSLGNQGYQGFQGNQGNQGVQGTQGIGFFGTTTSSFTFGSVGALTVSTQAGLGFIPGQRIRIEWDATNYSEGPVTSYSGTTIGFNVDKAIGIGTVASGLKIVLVGELGAQGNQGFQGLRGYQGYQGVLGAGYTIINNNTNLSLGTGARTFVGLPVGFAYTVGARIRATYAADVSRYMEGVITSTTASSITVNIDKAPLAGSYSSWNINLAGELGSQGYQGTPGNQGSQGFQGNQGNQGDTGTQGSIGGLAGGTLTGNINASGYQIQNAIITKYNETKSAPTISAGALTLDLSTDRNFDIAHNANITTLSITNVPASGNVVSVILILTQDGAGGKTIAWPGSVKWAGGSAPTLITTASKVNIITILTKDGGTTWFAFPSGLGF